VFPWILAMANLGKENTCKSGSSDWN